MEITEKDIEEIKNSIKAVEKAVQELGNTNAKQERDHEHIHDHRAILYGTKDHPGLMWDVEDLKRWKRDVNKAIWFLITPLLLAIGSGVVWLIIKSAGG